MLPVPRVGCSACARSAGSVPLSKGACGASRSPGVPAAVSTGGGVGLPDLVRDVRGFFTFAEAEDFRGSDMPAIWRAARLKQRVLSLGVRKQ